jgi:hypothetical protein
MPPRKAEPRLFALVHVAGPWEDAPPTDEGEPVIEQRCLRCDVLLAETDAPRAGMVLDIRSGYIVGTRVACAVDEDSKLRRYAVPNSRRLTKEEEDCSAAT